MPHQDRAFAQRGRQLRAAAVRMPGEHEVRAGRQDVEAKPAEFAQPRQELWIRVKGPLPDDPAIHRAALVYLSDMTLIETVMVAHGHSIGRGLFQTASLDHAVWLHRPFRADDWLLYAQETPTAQSSRGLTQGRLYTRDGVLAATTTQEGLVRRRPAPVSA